jgi:hypothetical protein
LPKFVDLVPQVLADSVVGVGGTDVPEVEGALAVGVVLDQTGRDDIEVVHYVREGRRDVNVPIGGTIAYDETLEVVALGLLVYAD